MLRCSSCTPSACSSAVTCWRVEAPFDFFHFYFSELDITQAVNQIWDREPGHVCLQEIYQGQDPVLAQAGQMLALSDWHAPGQAMAMDHLAQWLLLQILSRHASIRRAPPRVRGQLSHCYRRRLQEQIEAALSQPLTLADMASWVNLSPYHFARLFRATFGCAPYQYVQERRLLRARDLLRQPGIKITAIALECGFGDPSQFSRAFKARFGVTPTAYRRQTRQ